MRDIKFEENLSKLISKVDRLTTKDWADLVLELNLKVHPDSLRKAFAVTDYSGYNVAKYYQSIIKDLVAEKDDGETCSNDDLLEEIDKKMFQLQIERKKTQRINNEYHKNATKMADVSLRKEAILDAISNLKPLGKHNFPPVEDIEDEITGLLNLADVHYGDEFVIKNAFGEVINEYSPEEFRNRMWKLLADLEKELKKMPIHKLKVVGLGDTLSGVLRATSSLQQLKVGVVDGAMEYSEFMATWLNELSSKLKIPIEYSAVGGNHTVLRLLSSKADFPNEQMEKIVHQFIELRLSSNENITVLPYNDILIHDIYGLNVLFYHGEDKDLEKAMNFFSNYNKCNISLVITGHLHSKFTQSVGLGEFGDREIIRVNSIMGANEYSTKIRKVSRAGSELITFNKDGQQWRKTFYLN